MAVYPKFLIPNLTGRSVVLVLGMTTPAWAGPTISEDCIRGYSEIRSNTERGTRVPQELLALDMLGHPTIALHGNTGAVAWMTPKARSMLEKNFGALNDPGQMPDATSGWLSRALANSPVADREIGSLPVLRLNFGEEEVRLQIRGHLPEDNLTLVGIRQFSHSKLLAEVGSRYKLTPKEAEVFYWVAQGKTNPDIGLILGASRDTVRKHIENIYRKLGLSNRTQPAQMLMRDFPDFQRQ